MATFERNAHVDWEGTVKEGKGEVKAGTGAFSLPVTFPARVEKPGGKTSPEELIAAAHAACYAMALAATLGRKNAKARKLHVSATVGADFGEAGPESPSSPPGGVAEGAEGVQAPPFSHIAKEGEGGCPGPHAPRSRPQSDTAP